MDANKLAKLVKALAAARRSLQDARDLEAIASMAERTPYSGGNHVMWHSAFPAHRAFPIGRHGGDQKVGHHAQKVILAHLDADAAAWQEHLDRQEQENGGEQ